MTDPADFDTEYVDRQMADDASETMLRYESALRSIRDYNGYGGVIRLIEIADEALSA